MKEPEGTMVHTEDAGRLTEERVTRAVREGGEYTWTRRGSVWECETAKGTSYTVCDGGCSCEDWKWRGSKTGIPCKHIIARNRKLLELGELP